MQDYTDHLYKNLNNVWREKTNFLESDETVLPTYGEL